MTHRYLFVVWDGGGTVPPVMGLAQRLIRRGHHVTVLADAITEADVRAAGAAFVPFTEAPSRTGRGRDDDPVKDWETSSPAEMIARMRDRLMCGPAARYARDVAAEIARGHYDAVASEGMAIGTLIAAEASGLPHAALWPIFDIRPIEGRPPVGPGFLPATNILERWRDRLLTAFFMRVMGKGLAPINEARTSLGLPPIAHPFDQYARADRSLLMTSRHFDFPGPMLPNMRYVGPQLEDPAWAQPWTPPAGHDPLVLATLGSTFQDQEGVYRKLIEALGALRVRGVVTLGKVFPPSAFASPANVQTVESAPHGAIFPHAALAVIHGGHGTTTKALAAGLPLVVVPLGRDQLDNAARVVHAGAGVMVKPTASVARMRDAIARVLGDPAYRLAAQRLAEAMRVEAEGDPAVQEMEALPGLRAASRMQAPGTDAASSRPTPPLTPRVARPS
ncbi:MAG TPA: glycosyltransferase [Nevskiaceae bacterium]|nr:glycosyltransferase [Nevskiaceae bacterium]